MIEDLWRQLFIYRNFINQLGAFLLVLLVSGVLARLLKRVIDRWQRGLQSRSLSKELPWLLNIFPIVTSVVRPIALWLLTAIAAGAFENFRLVNDLLIWTTTLMGLIVLYRFLRALLDQRLGQEVSRTWSHHVLRPTFWILVLLHTIGLLDNILDLSFNPTEDIIISLRSLLSGLILFYIFLLLSRTIRQLLKETILPRAGVDPSITQIVSTITFYALMITGVLVGLSTAGVSLTVFTVIAGGLSVGIGFGLQDLINNFISGFILLFERSIIPGDVIEVDGQVGPVEEIGLRSLRFRTADGIEIIVPTGKLLANPVINYTRSDNFVRIRIDFPVHKDSDPAVVRDLLEKATVHDLVVENPGPQVMFTGISDQGLDIKVQLWVKDITRKGMVASDLRYLYYQILTENGIRIAYPVTDIRMLKDDPL